MSFRYLQINISSFFYLNTEPRFVHLPPTYLSESEPLFCLTDSELGKEESRLRERFWTRAETRTDHQNVCVCKDPKMLCVTYIT